MSIEISSEQYSILFCDDEQDFLDAYKKMIETSSELKNLFKDEDVRCSKTYSIGLGKYDSVKDIVEEYKENNELINIAVIDVNFEKSKELNDYIDSDDFSYHNLGILIASYLQKNMRGIEIIFVTANPAETKSTKSLMAENIHYIEKQSGAKLEDILEKKIIELIETRVPKKKVTFDSYLYEIDYIGSREYEITNNNIRNGSESLKVKFELTPKVDNLLKTIIYLSCIMSDKLSKKPNNILVKDIKELYLKFENEEEREEYYPLYREKEQELLKLIFKSVSKSENSSCYFDYIKAKKFKFGKNADCNKTCNSFLSINKTCPMLLDYNYNQDNRKNKDIDISKSINRLKFEIKENILIIENILEFKNIISNSLISLDSDTCSCNANNFTSIKNCQHPFCPNSLIFSEKSITKTSETKYSFLAKPTDKLIQHIIDIMKDKI